MTRRRRVHDGSGRAPIPAGARRGSGRGPTRRRGRRRSGCDPAPDARHSDGHDAAPWPWWRGVRRDPVPAGRHSDSHDPAPPPVVARGTSGPGAPEAALRRPCPRRARCGGRSVMTRCPLLGGCTTVIGRRDAETAPSRCALCARLVSHPSASVQWGHIGRVGWGTTGEVELGRTSPGWPPLHSWWRGGVACDLTPGPFPGGKGAMAVLERCSTGKPSPVRAGDFGAECWPPYGRDCSRPGRPQVDSRVRGMTGGG